MSGSILRYLDYFYISNSMQVSVKKTDVLTDQSQLHFHIVKMKKAIEVEAFGNLITAWLKMKNMFTRWKNLFQIL